MIRTNASRRHLTESWATPLEVDVRDWAEQQLAEPFPDDEYPRTSDVETLIA
jgi:hypothetical protein